jgi:hypothetical protein
MQIAIRMSPNETLIEMAGIIVTEPMIPKIIQHKMWKGKARVRSRKKWIGKIMLLPQQN